MRVLVCGGGTGGHVFPALAVLNELKARGCNTLYVGSSNGLESRLSLPENHVLLNVKGIRGKGIRAVWNSFLLLGSILKSIKVIRNFKPDSIVLFGGYVSLPMGLATIIMRRNFILQEQNSIPGKTTLFLSRFSRNIMLGNRLASKFFKKSIYTGNPLRHEIVEFAVERKNIKQKLIKDLDLDNGKITVLVIGGSQGALFINKLMASALKNLSKLNKRIQFIHITGRGKEGNISSLYKSYGFKARVLPFTDKPWVYYCVSDIAISRSGAIAVSELSAFDIPTFFIPYPFAVDNHQYFNVKDIYESGGCMLKRQETITPNDVKSFIISMMDKSKRNSMAAKFRSFSKIKATSKAVEVILSEEHQKSH